MEKDIDAALADIAENREIIIGRLIDFSMTDMLLFWGINKELAERQKQLWQPILDWMQDEINVKFITTSGLDVPRQDDIIVSQMRLFLKGLNDKQLLAFFKAALNMRSVLLAAALVKGRLTADAAFEAAFVEEIWQAENWGVVDEAESRRNDLKKELVEIENFLKSAA
jgi:chaperone required for assembly of F1-ATPase